MEASLVLLPGDGIGPEVVAEAERVLAAVAKKFAHKFHTQKLPMGGNAIDSHGDPLPEETLAACRQSAAILLGAVAGQHCSTPTIMALTNAAGNGTPVIGYTITYAISNVLLPLLGPIAVAMAGALASAPP